MTNKFHLGKHVPRHDSRTLRFAKYIAKLPAPPAVESWYTAVPSYPMDGNDSVGDCTIAGAAHMIETWTYNESPPTKEDFSTQDCLNDYYALTGGPDTGLDLLTVLQQWQGAGLSWHGGNPDVIAAYTQLSTGDAGEAQQGIALFGGVYIGLELPNFIVYSVDPTAIVWDVPPGGAVGPNAPNPSNGHCVCLVGYDANYLYFVTWGAVVKMTYAFYAAYSDEGYAILTQDWMGSGEAPSGFDLAQLQADLAQVTSSPPSPTPPQPPTPDIWQEIIADIEKLLKKIREF